MCKDFFLLCSFIRKLKGQDLEDECIGGPDEYTEEDGSGFFLSKQMQLVIERLSKTNSWKIGDFRQDIKELTKALDTSGEDKLRLPTPPSKPELVFEAAEAELLSANPGPPLTSNMPRGKYKVWTVEFESWKFGFCRLGTCNANNNIIFLYSLHI